MCSSKKGISTRQIHRIIGGSLKTAWFLGHRIREAMRSGELGPMGGTGASVEADETYIGRKEVVPVRRGYPHKRAVLSLVERGGKVRSFHVDKATVSDVVPIVKENISPHQYGGGILLDLQARVQGHLPALRRAALAPLPGGI